MRCIMKKLTLIFLLSFFFFNSIILAQEKKVADRLKDFNQYMEKIISDWNAPGIGVGIVYKDKLIFSKGYGYRDYDKKLPVTANTLFQIA